MKIHHREMLLHASALLHQTGDLLAELVRTVDEDRDADEEIPTAATTFDEPRPYYVQRTAHEIWGQREWLTENEIAAKLHGVWNIARGVEREEGAPKVNVRSTLNDDYGANARAAPGANARAAPGEESVMDFAKRAASEYVGSRLGTIDEGYREAQRERNAAGSRAAADMAGNGRPFDNIRRDSTEDQRQATAQKFTSIEESCARQRAEKPVAAVNALDLVVTLNGVPFRDQTLGIRLFKEACDNSIERERNGTLDTPPYYDRG